MRLRPGLLTKGVEVLAGRVEAMPPKPLADGEEPTGEDGDQSETPEVAHTYASAPTTRCSPGTVITLDLLLPPLSSPPHFR